MTKVMKSNGVGMGVNESPPPGAEAPWLLLPPYTASCSGEHWPQPVNASAWVLPLLPQWCRSPRRGDPPGFGLFVPLQSSPHKAARPQHHTWESWLQCLSPVAASSSSHTWWQRDWSVQSDDGFAAGRLKFTPERHYVNSCQGLEELPCLQLLVTEWTKGRRGWDHPQTKDVYLVSKKLAHETNFKGVLKGTAFIIILKIPPPWNKRPLLTEHV